MPNLKQFQLLPQNLGAFVGGVEPPFRFQAYIGRNGKLSQGAAELPDCDWVSGYQ
jgi:hypothetical protein